MRPGAQAPGCILLTENAAQEKLIRFLLDILQAAFYN
jgi:hypothetical protein